MTHGLRLALPALALLSLIGCQTGGKSKFLPPKTQPVNLPLPSEAAAKRSSGTPATTLPTPTPPSQPVITPAQASLPAATSSVLPVSAPATLPTVTIAPPEQPITLTPSAIVPPKVDEPRFEKPALPN